MKKLIYLLLAVCLFSCTQKPLSPEEIARLDSIDANTPQDEKTIALIKQEAENLFKSRPEAFAASAVNWNGPKPKHIFIFNLENRNPSDVYTSSNAKYVRDNILPKSVRFSNYVESNNESQPNYKDFQGQTRSGIVDNSEVPWNSITTQTLNTVLKNAGKSVRSYFQGVTSRSNLLKWSSEDNRMRHSFQWGYKDTKDTDFYLWSEFPSDLSQTATLNYMQLGESANSHNTGVSTWSEFLRTDSNFQRTKRYCDITGNESIYILWTDEDAINGNTGQVPVIIGGAMCKENYIISSPQSHKSLSKMICYMFGSPGINTGLDAQYKVDTTWYKKNVVNPVDTSHCYGTIHKARTIEYDSTYVIPCDSSHPSGYSYGMYIQGARAKIIDPAKSTILFNYCKQIGVNTIALYSYQTIFGNASDELRLISFCQTAHIKGIKVVGTYSSVSEIDKVGAFVTAHPGTIDGLKDEFEIYNQVDKPAALAKDTAALKHAKDVCQQTGMTLCDKYEGWPVDISEYRAMNRNCTGFTFHFYRTTIDTGYGRQRVIDLNKNATGNKPFDPLLSIEPLFLKAALLADKNLLAKATDKFKVMISHFSNLTFGQIFIFTDDYLMQCIPYINPGNAVENTVNYSGPDFDPNYTDPKHIQLSQEK